MNIIYLSHGGGPIPLLGAEGHEKMVDFLRRLPAIVGGIEEILVISAHWEETLPTVVSSREPGLLYDYYGFPDEAYSIRYQVSDNRELSGSVVGALRGEGVEATVDETRGLDHGVFVPLKIAYPEGDIPVTQLSLIRGLNPQEHINLGRALRNLSDRNILVVGSGFSFHNMGAFSMDPSPAGEDPRNDAFQDWLVDVCCTGYDDSGWEESLVNWSSAPNARYCHPREEHLLPLHVCQGLAGRKARVVFDDYILGKRSVALMW